MQYRRTLTSQCAILGRSTNTKVHLTGALPGRNFWGRPSKGTRKARESWILAFSKLRIFVSSTAPQPATKDSRGGITNMAFSEQPPLTNALQMPTAPPVLKRGQCRSCVMNFG